MSGAPLPLLGTFHEVSCSVPDVRAAVEFYERLGFVQAPTSDTFAHLYGVLTDGRLAIGLHQRAGPTPVLSFVRPGIAACLGALADAGLELTRARTGEEEFNEVELTDPFGHALAVLEARTFSPVARGPGETSLCGDFAEVSLPVADFAAAQSFWEPLGFVADTEVHSPYSYLPLTSDHLDISFHSPAVCARALLVFRDAAMPARIARLRELGIVPAAGRGSGPGGGTLIETPDGTPLLLLPAEE
jgi:catechol 2,3-dioxygenase-like lactoylglutathione lyase family enzyme